MVTGRWWPRALLAAAFVPAIALSASGQGSRNTVSVESLPSSRVAIRAEGSWRTWWQSGSAPARWTTPHATVTGALKWQRVREGLDVAELSLSGVGEARRIRVIVARLDPAAFELRLEAARFSTGRAGPWSVSRAAQEAVVAFNAGMFSERRPWGWVVHEGREIEPPGSGPLAPAIVVDSAGRVRLVPSDSIAIVRASGGARAAFQSYPALLMGEGEVPEPLRAPNRGVDVSHRDSRLALGILPDGGVLLVLTRFDGLGGVLSPLPVGLTVPEMAGLMGALGARQAVLLDGGVSGQLLVRDDAGRPKLWPGWRDVPLGMVAAPRTVHYGAR